MDANPPTPPMGGSAPSSGSPGLADQLKRVGKEWLVLAGILLVAVLLAHFLPNRRGPMVDRTHDGWWHKLWYSPERNPFLTLSTGPLDDTVPRPDLGAVYRSPFDGVLWVADRSGSLYSSVDDGRTWEVHSLRYLRTSTFAREELVHRPIQRIRFWNKEVGWAEGSVASVKISGEQEGFRYVFRTINGGRDWYLADETRFTTNGPPARHSYWFMEFDTGLALRGNQLQGTTNGGIGWFDLQSVTNLAAIRYEPIDPSDQDAVDAEAAALVKESTTRRFGALAVHPAGRAWLGAGGGLVWQSRAVVRGATVVDVDWAAPKKLRAAGLIALDSASGTFAYGLSAAGEIVVSTNGMYPYETGWEVRSRVDLRSFIYPEFLGPKATFPGVLLMSAPHAALQFVTTNEAWLLVQQDSFGSSAHLFRTIDGGRGWQSVEAFTNAPATRQPYPVHFPKAMWFASGEKGWLVGDAFLVLRTLDGGVTWYNVVSRHSIGLPGWFWVVLVLVLMRSVWLLSRPPPSPRRAARIRFQTDDPIEDESQDCFGTGRVTTALARFFRNPDTKPPFSVAITGDWGVGKSSQMLMLRRKLMRGGVRTVWFNAWHYQNEESLFPFLLRHIKDDAVPRGFGLSTIQFYLGLAWLRARRHVGWTILAAMLLLSGGILLGFYATYDAGERAKIITDATQVAPRQQQPSVVPSQTPATPGPSSVTPQPAPPAGAEGTGSTPAKSAVRSATKEDDHGWPAWLNSLLESIEDWVKGVFGPVTAAVLLGLLSLLWKAMKPFAAKPEELLFSVARAASVKDLGGRISVQSQFRDEFADVTEALGDKQAVILIDDLDRCSPGKVLEMLEAINFLVSSGDCFVVLALSRRQIEVSLALAFANLAAEMSLTPAELGLAADFPDGPGKRRMAVARLYLRKLLQLEIRVPGPTPEQLATKVKATPRSERDEQVLSGWEKLLQWGRLILGNKPAWALLLVCGVGVWLGGRASDWFPNASSPAKIPPASRPVASPVATLTSGDSANRPATGASTNPAVAGLTNQTTRPASTNLATSLTATNLGANVGSNDVAVIRLPELTRPMLLPPSPPSGDRPRIGRYLVFVLALAGFGVAVWVVLRRAVSIQYRDSKELVKALDDWRDEWTAVNNTPREAIRFINRVRYLALRTQGDTAAATTERELAVRWVARILHRLKLAKKPVETPSKASGDSVKGNTLTEADAVVFYCHQSAARHWARAGDSEKRSALDRKLAAYLKTRGVTEPDSPLHRAYAKLAAEIGEERGDDSPDDTGRAAAPSGAPGV